MKCYLTSTVTDQFPVPFPPVQTPLLWRQYQRPPLPLLSLFVRSCWLQLLFPPRLLYALCLSLSNSLQIRWEYSHFVCVPPPSLSPFPTFSFMDVTEHSQRLTLFFCLSFLKCSLLLRANIFGCSSGHSLCWWSWEGRACAGLRPLFGAIWSWKILNWGFWITFEEISMYRWATLFQLV